MKKYYCNICQATREFKPVATVKNERKNIKVKLFTYFSCLHCSFWILKPDVLYTDNLKIYKGDYYSDLEAPLTNPLLNLIFKIKLFSSYEDIVANNTLGKNLLDIGCGTGKFLKNMQNRGFNVYGIDPYADAVKLTNKKLGNNRVIKGYIKNINKIEPNFDSITLWHVLEHTENPLGDLKSIRSKLKKKGKLFLEVPNSDSLSLSLFKEWYSWHMVPEHHIYFNSKSLKIVLDKAGLKIENIYTPPRALLNYSYSLKNYLQPKLHTTIAFGLFLLSIPVSVCFVLLSSLLNKGEVVRVIATRE